MASGRIALGVRPGSHGERGERAGEREREAQRRPTRCGARGARRELVAAGGRSEQPFGSAATAALPRIVRHSRHGYSDSLLGSVAGAPMDYKATLNLPRTDFPMKANLAQREPETVRRWGETHVYERLLAANAGRPRFLLHDGPPYAKGHIPLGTSLNTA